MRKFVTLVVPGSHLEDKEESRAKKILEEWIQGSHHFQLEADLWELYEPKAYLSLSWVSVISSNYTVRTPRLYSNVHNRLRLVLRAGIPLPIVSPESFCLSHWTEPSKVKLLGLSPDLSVYLLKWLLLYLQLLLSRIFYASSLCLANYNISFRPQLKKMSLHDRLPTPPPGISLDPY